MKITKKTSRMKLRFSDGDFSSLKKTFGILTLAFASFTIHSCNEKETAPAAVSKSANQPDKVYQQILNLGFSKESIQDAGADYLVQGDMIFHKNKNYSNAASLSTGRIQQRVGGSFIPFGADRIKVRIKQGMAGFTTTIQQAMDDWNSLQSSVYLVRETASDAAILDANIGLTITNGSFPIPDGTGAESAYIQGEIPFDGGTGRFISANQPRLAGGFNSGITLTMVRSMMVHAIGHTLGFFHTDDLSATIVPGSPVTDGGSVMNGGDMRRNWNGFSSADVAATLHRFPAPKLFTAINRLYSIASLTAPTQGSLANRWIQMGDTNWAGTTAMTTIGNNLYILENGTLHRVDRYSGNYTVIGAPGDFGSNPLGMATAGDGFLYIISPGGCLYQVDPDTDATIRVGCGWQGAQFMAGGTNSATSAHELFILRNGTLYSVNPTNNFRVAINSWNAATAMTYGNGRVFIVNGGALQWTDATGALSGFINTSSTTVAYSEGQVFVIDGNTLFSIPDFAIGGGRDVNVFTQRSLAGEWPGVTATTSF